MTAPCGGCPPCCEKCVFSNEAESIQQGDFELVMEQYGCVHDENSQIVSSKEKTGLLTRNGFFPLKDESVSWLASQGNENQLKLAMGL